MSIKNNSKELVAIAQQIAGQANLDIDELVETNKKEELNRIWKEAVTEFDKRNMKKKI
ncbi:MAG: hypothetical protein ACRCW0_06800 [Clostridium sp.]